MKEFNVYLTFDIDQDFAPNSVDYYNRSKADFSIYKNKFTTLIDTLEGLPFSVFLRSDYQIKKLYGSYEYLIENNLGLVNKINNCGGEINWHIHLYKKLKNQWKQILDEDEIYDRFIEDFTNVKKIDLINSQVVRIGECVMNNKLMNAISRSRIKIDSSALPGRKRNDQQKFFDWETTTNDFYYVSKTDYRTSSNDNYDIKEIPLTTIPMKAAYDNSPIKRYFNLSFKTEILFENLESYIKNNNNLVSITHPFEVLY